MKATLNLIKLMEMENFIMIMVKYIMRVNLRMTVFIKESYILEKVFFFFEGELKQMEKEYFIMKMGVIVLEFLRMGRQMVKEQYLMKIIILYIMEILKMVNMMDLVN